MNKMGTIKDELTKILMKSNALLEQMLGDGKGGASSILAYYIKNAKPITTTLMAPTVSLDGYFNNIGVEPLLFQEHKHYEGVKI